MTSNKSFREVHEQEIQKLFPKEHLPVLHLLLRQLVEATLKLPLKPIENAEAIKIKRILEEHIGKSLSEKVIREMVNAAAAGTPNIRKSRAGTLNLLTKFVMGKYEPNNASKEAMDNHNYWDLFLEKNEHLIILNAGNGTDKKQANHPENLTIDDTITSLDGQASNHSSMHTVTTHLLLQENKQKILSIKLMEAGIAGGFIAGLVNALLVIVFPPLLNGYHNLPANDLITLIPRIAFSNIIGGTGVGLLLAYFGNPDKAKNALSGFSIGQIVFIAILLLSLLVVFKQSAARSAWTTRGILEGSDFETVAYFFSMLTGVIYLLKVIRKNNSMGLIQSLTSTLLIVLNASIPLFLVFLYYRAIIFQGPYDLKSYPGNGLELFIFQYTHPERIILIISMTFTSVLIFLNVRSLFLNSSMQHNRDNQFE